jgi:hypothetical protein
MVYVDILQPLHSMLANSGTVVLYYFLISCCHCYDLPASYLTRNSSRNLHMLIKHVQSKSLLF